MNKLILSVVTFTQGTIRFGAIAAMLLSVSFHAVANNGHLADVLSHQSVEQKARYVFRHPQKTLEFFGIQRGMTVAEALPGGGWYSKILLPFLGEKGHLIGIGYAEHMFPEFRFFSEEEFLAKQTWASSWISDMNNWEESHAEFSGKNAKISAYNFGGVSKDLAGKVDAVLFIRALHNLNRFENDGQYLTTALKESYEMLKPGGIVGVVQHQAPHYLSNSAADGSHGYLKKNKLIKTFEKAGFELVAQSDINENSKDKPSEGDIVWRLPPLLSGSRTDEMKARYTKIGESNRMTLKFRKPE